MVAPPPPPLKGLTVRQRQDDLLVLEYTGALPELLAWLAGQPVQELRMEPLGLHLALVPGGFTEKPLQFLRSRKLRSHQGFGIDQSGQRLMSFRG